MAVYGAPVAPYYRPDPFIVDLARQLREEGIPAIPGMPPAGGPVGFISGFRMRHTDPYGFGRRVKELFENFFHYEAPPVPPIPRRVYIYSTANHYVCNYYD